MQKSRWKRERSRKKRLYSRRLRSKKARRVLPKVIRPKKPRIRKKQPKSQAKHQVKSLRTMNLRMKPERKTAAREKKEKIQRARTRKMSRFPKKISLQKRLMKRSIISSLQISNRFRISSTFHKSTMLRKRLSPSLSGMSTTFFITISSSELT